MKLWLLFVSLFASLAPRLAHADEPKPDDPPPHVERPPMPTPRAMYQPHRDPPPPPPPPPPTGIEPSIVVTQALLAGAISLVAATQMFPDPLSETNLVIMGLTPLAVGGVVCAVGSGSERVEGSCLSSLAGAYLGAGAAVGLFYLGYALDRASDDNDSDVHIPIFTFFFAAAGVVIQPVAAMGAWHGFSHKRPGAPVLNPAPLPPPPRSAFAPERRRGLALAPGQVTVPLLSLGF